MHYNGPTASVTIAPDLLTNAGNMTGFLIVLRVELPGAEAIFVRGGFADKIEARETSAVTGVVKFPPASFRDRILSIHRSNTYYPATAIVAGFFPIVRGGLYARSGKIDSSGVGSA